MRVVFRQCFTREAKAMIVAELVRRDMPIEYGEVLVQGGVLYLETSVGQIEVCLIAILPFFSDFEIPAVQLLRELGYGVEIAHGTFSEVTEIRQSIGLPL